MNSFSASPSAPVAASVKSWARRASDSMTRSSTTSWAIRLASDWLSFGSKSSTFEAMLTLGIEGSTHTRAVPDMGTAFPNSEGSELAAEVAIHPAGSGPAPTMSTTAGNDPSDSSAAGTGLCVDRSDASGTQPTQTRVAAAIAGVRQPRRRSAASGLPPCSSGSSSRASANRPAHAMTRLARIAVLVQNSRVVGPSSRTESRATTTPNTSRAAWPSGTVRGSGTMNRAKINTSGEVTRICHRSRPHRAVTCQLATMQWSGTGASARATKAANPSM